MEFADAIQCKEVRALLAVARRDAEALRGACQGGIQARMLVKHLKNIPDELDFFLGVLGVDPGAGHYFFSDVKDNHTFDIYKKHGINPSNLHKDTVTPEQWLYLQQIGYVQVREVDYLAMILESTWGLPDKAPPDGEIEQWLTEQCAALVAAIYECRERDDDEVSDVRKYAAPLAAAAGHLNVLRHLFADQRRDSDPDVDLLTVQAACARNRTTVLHYLARVLDMRNIDAGNLECCVEIACNAGHITTASYMLNRVIKFCSDTPPDRFDALAKLISASVAVKS
jgi:hypothetical protein